MNYHKYMIFLLKYYKYPGCTNYDIVKYGNITYLYSAPTGRDFMFSSSLAIIAVRVSIIATHVSPTIVDALRHAVEWEG